METVTEFESHLKFAIDMRLTARNLKKKDFKIKRVASRRYDGNTQVYTWVIVEVNGKVYPIREPYMGKRTTGIKNTLILTTMMLMEEQERANNQK